MTPLAIFRADASPIIGGGHVMRCLTLADELARRGWRCVFASKAETASVVPAAASRIELTVNTGDEPTQMAERWPAGCDLLVVDSYAWTQELETLCRPWARRILAVDDAPSRPHDADLLVDQNLGRIAADYQRVVSDRCRVLAGTDYALLRPQFAAARPRAVERRAFPGSVQRVLISLGLGHTAIDPGQTLQALADSKLRIQQVDMVLGPLAPAPVGDWPFAVTIRRAVHDMAELMVEADLAIGAAGATSWERCCLGLPSVVVVIADNQLPLAIALEEAGAASYVRTNASTAELTQALNLLAGPDSRRPMAAAALAICDGAGASRVADAVCSP